jgi:transmembrane sensor
MWVDWLPWIGERLIERRLGIYMAELVDDPTSRRAEFEKWLSRGARRRRVYAETLEFWRAEGWDKGVDFPRPDASAAVSMRLSYWQSMLPIMTAATAIIAIVAWLGIGNLGRFLDRSDRVSHDVPTDAVAYGTGPGETRSVRLTDGSVVTLQPETSLAVSLQPALRQLKLLRGHARFQVATNRAWPFMVWAGGGSTTATGTLFDVSFQSDRTVRVDLLEGSVLVASPHGHDDDPDGPRPTRLAAGEHAVYKVAAGSLVGSRDPIGPGTAQSGEANIHFEYEHLDSVVARLNPHSVVRIGLADPALGQLRVYGNCNLQDVPGFVKSLAISLDLDIVETPGLLLLQAKSAPEK